MKKIIVFIVLIALAIGFVAYNEDKIFPENIREMISRNVEESKRDSSIIISDLTGDSVKSSFECNHQKVIVPMDISEESSFIKIKVNGIPMKFMIDTGSNTMSIGYADYLFLERQGLVPKEIKHEDVKLADGSIKKFASIILDSISVGTATFKNIECLVYFPDSSGNIPDVPPLVGFNTFFKFSKMISMNPETKEFIIELK